MQSSSSNSGKVGEEEKSSKKETEKDEYTGLKLLSEHFEHDAELGTIKYAVKYLIKKEDKVYEMLKRKMIAVGGVMLPLCLLGCMRKMIGYGKSHGINTNAIGIVFSSEQIPFGGRICEQIKPANMNLDKLVDRILDKLNNLEVELDGGHQFEIIVNGVQQQENNASSDKYDKEKEVTEESNDENDDEEPGAKLLEEKFEQNLTTRTVKYTGKFKLVNHQLENVFLKLFSGGRMDQKKILDFAAKLVPDSFNKCVEKMRAHARAHGILPNCIGFTLRSPNIPGGIYTEPLKPNVNVAELMGRVLDVTCDNSPALEVDPYTMIITGQQRDLKQGPGVRLLDELFEQNTEERTVKFTGKFFIEDDFGKIFEGYTGCTCVSTTLDIVLEMFPKCFHECFVKMLDHGRCYGLKPTKIGYIIRSEKIPTNGGEICEPVKICTDLRPLVKSIVDKLEQLDMDLMGKPFTVIVKGTE